MHWTRSYSIIHSVIIVITFRQVLNASEVFLQPGYPMAMSPIRIKVYVRLPAAGDTSVSLERGLLTNVLQPLVQNITNTFGVQISGTQGNQASARLSDSRDVSKLRRAWSGEGGGAHRGQTSKVFFVYLAGFHVPESGSMAKNVTIFSFLTID